MNSSLSMSDEDFLKSSSEDTAGYIEVSEDLVTQEEQEQEVTTEDQASVDETSSPYDENYSGEQTEDSDDEEETVEEEVTNQGTSRIYQPFKANGVEIQARNEDEVITLMQKGANYTKKMQGLKPHLKLLKTLEVNGLLDADKINYLIDLSKNNPKAINKLVKDADYNQYDHGGEEDEDYTPNDYQVSDSQMEIQSVLDEIKHTDTFQACLDVIGKKWDNDSKVAFLDKPQYIAELNEQMSLGIFDKIMAEVDRVRMFGGLEGMSDFDAYRTVGRKLSEEGAFNKPQPVAVTKPKSPDTTQANKRRAVASPKAANPSQAKQAFNPLAMSDEEFNKLSQDFQYI